MSLRRSLWFDCGGGAMAEATIVLPIFILLFAMVGYFYRSAAVAQDELIGVRRAMWAKALPGCRQGGEPDLALQGLLETDNFNLQARATVTKLAPFFDTIKTAVISESSTAQVNRPAILGGGNREIKTLLRTECNEPLPYEEGSERDTEASLWPAIKDTFCKFAPCSSSGMECTPPASQCLGLGYEQICTPFNDAGVWDVPTRCNLDAREFCMRGRCEVCDPEADRNYEAFMDLSGEEQAAIDTPPCPPGVGGAGGSDDDGEA